MVKRLLLFCLTMFPVWGSTITLDFRVEMDWRYDLAASSFDSAFVPFTMNVRAVVDDRRIGSISFPPDTTRILFDGVQITSPLSGLMDMGYDVSLLSERSSTVSVQDTFITEVNQGTWTNLYEQFSANGVTLGRNLQFTNDSRLSDPANFNTPDLRSLLASHLGKQYTYREDITFPGGGYQHHGLATLTNVSFADTTVPEPSSGWLVMGALAVCAFTNRRSSIGSWSGVGRRLDKGAPTQTNV
jgi:hypothetical protein